MSSALPAVRRANGLRPKKLYASVKELSTPVLVPRQYPLALSSHQLRLSDNDNSDDQMKPEVMHRYPGIYLTTEKPRKTSARRLCDQSSP